MLRKNSRLVLSAIFGLGSLVACSGGESPIPGNSPGGESNNHSGNGKDNKSGGGSGNSGSTGGSGAGQNGGEGAAQGSGGTTNGGETVGSGRCSGGVGEGRYMECLDRGVIAARNNREAFISWRLFGTDPADIEFNLYREVPGVEPALVCSRGPSEGTWCKETVSSNDAKYFVRPVIDGVEGEASGSATLLAQDYIRIPLHPAAPGAFVHLAWVGDLDGDGEYDFVVNRISASQPVVDGYSRQGEFLWRLDTGPLGVDQNNIEGGATTMSNGMWDGATVYDFDSDGFAEIAIKTANGFVFGDGKVLRHSNDEDQFVSIVNGKTGAEITRAPLPGEYKVDGPLQCHFGVGYFDGVRPSVAVKCKNRVGRGGFNLVIAAYDFDGTALTERFKYLRGNDNAPDYHQIRLMDVNGDGKDEFLDGGYVLNHEGRMLYSLGEQGVVHGDRFHVTDMDPARPGLEGFGIQQDNVSGLETYYYDAATGEILRRHSVTPGPGGDLARGTVADLYSDKPGLEYFSFNGMFSAPSGELIAPGGDKVPWPNFSMQWDGDLGTELLDNNRVGDWNLTAQARNTYVWRRSFEGAYQARGAIPFYGDIFGDWRDEALLEHNGELRIYTTMYETEHRIYTMVHNPAYRNSLTVHGYKQSHHVDYFLGFGMSPPPAPKIRLVQRK